MGRAIADDDRDIVDVRPTRSAAIREFLDAVEAIEIAPETGPTREEIIRKYGTGGTIIKSAEAPPLASGAKPGEALALARDALERAMRRSGRLTGDET